MNEEGITEQKEAREWLAKNYNWGKARGVYNKEKNIIELRSRDNNPEKVFTKKEKAILVGLSIGPLN